MNKIKITVFQIMIFILIALSFFSCKKQIITDPVNNLPEEKYDPGRRDYNWKLDTLEMPMNLIDALWGSSPSDVWVVGGGSDEENILWHFDGNSWKLYYNPSFSSGYTLFGFSQNNVWMGCSNGEIWHFDGSKWTRNFNFYIEGSGIIDINSIWGVKPDDIYACGDYVYHIDGKMYFKGFILHYDGLTWKEICRGEKNYQFLKIRGRQDRIYLSTYKLSGVSTRSDIIAYYILEGNWLRKIYSGTVGNIAISSFELINGELYFWINNDVDVLKNKYQNTTEIFSTKFKVDEPRFSYYLCGRNSSDIFISMYDGLAHYNGSDIQYILRFPETSSFIGGQPAIFEKEIFCGIYDNTIGKNLVLHGKLKE